jgi:hypothetical protein
MSTMWDADAAPGDAQSADHHRGRNERTGADLLRVCGVRVSFFPSGRSRGLDEGPYSGALKQNMVQLCGLLPYEQAAAVMTRIGKRPVSDSSLWRRVQQAGQQLSERTAADQRDTRHESSAESPGPDTKLLSMDGGLVNIFGEGWTEFKVGLVGAVVAEKPDPSDRARRCVHWQNGLY